MKPKPVHLPGRLKPDHSHICSRCGRSWHCRSYSLKDCQSKGLIKAAQPDGYGPFCFDCQQAIALPDLPD